MDNNRLKKFNNSRPSPYFCLLLTACFLILSPLKIFAMEFKLSSDDGSTKFAVIREGSNITAFDSDGGMVVEGSATIKNALRAAKFLSKTYTGDLLLKTTDFGKTVTINSASDRTVSLPVVDSGDIGGWFKIVKLGNGKVTIDADTGDTIADSGLGETIYCSTPAYASLTLQLANASEWVITEGYGRWMTTESSSDKTLFNYSYWLRFLPDTGQDKCYNNTEEMVTWPTEGQDFYGQDAQYQPAYPQMYYTDNGDGTVTDNRTGLMWLQNANDYNSGNTQTWEQALSGCESFEFPVGVYDDWRLPNVNELASLLVYDEALYDLEKPLISEPPFQNTQTNYYWTSTTYVPQTGNALFVDFTYGGVNYFVYLDDKTFDRYVRPVRGGP